MRKDKTPKPEMAEARSQGLLNIGEAAAATGVSAKSIRHYEQIGLVPPAHRSFANYRLYSQQDLHTLRFIKRARALGFATAKIGQLLNLWQDQQRNSADVKQLALEHVATLDAQIKELQSMRDTLAALAHSCHGDHRPDCPILEGLVGNKGTGSCH